MPLQTRLVKQCVEDPLIWPNKVEARAYQQTIADKAAQRNTLVVLPTALGKTIISRALSLSTTSKRKSVAPLSPSSTNRLGVKL